MDAPLRKCCGQRHWPIEGECPNRKAEKVTKTVTVSHVVAPVIHTPVANIVANDTVVAPMQTAEIGPAVMEVGASTYRYRDPEKRRAYMRDLMKRKRAKA